MRLLFANAFMATVTGGMLLPRVANEFTSNPLNTLTLYFAIATAGIIYSQLTYCSFKLSYILAVALMLLAL